MSVYGNDLILQDGDVIPTAKGEMYTAEDYEMVRGSSTMFPGYYQMIFAIANSLFTVKGDISYHPEYGSELPFVVGQNASPNLTKLIQDSVTTAALADPRVKSVESVIVDYDGSTASVKANLVLSGRTSASQFVFPNIVVE